MTDEESKSSLEFGGNSPELNDSLRAGIARKKFELNEWMYIPIKQHETPMLTILAQVDWQLEKRNKLDDIATLEKAVKILAT